MDDLPSPAKKNITSFKGQVVRGNVPVMARMLILVASPLSFLLPLMGFIQTGNRFVCCAALLGKNQDFLIIEIRMQRVKVTLSRRQIQQIWVRLVEMQENQTVQSAG